MTLLCTYTKIETDVAQNLINDFFLYFWLSEDLSTGRILSLKKNRGTGLISEKTEVLQAELNGRVEAATTGYSSAGDFFTMYLFCACG